MNLAVPPAIRFRFELHDRMERLNNAASQYVSTAQVSKALGVSVTTVKRWVDDAILPAHRTAGGHRKLLLADVQRAVRLGNLPQADLSSLQPVAHDTERVLRSFTAAVKSLDAEAIRGLLLGAYRGGLPIESIADEIIAPGMAHMGHQWQAGKVDVMHEHRVSQAVLVALYELHALLRTQAAKERPVAIGGAPEHDHSRLPSMLAKLTLLECGWDAIDLGPHTPFSALTAAIEAYSPRLVWLSATHIVKPKACLAEYQAFYAVATKRGVAVAIGGRGITDLLRTQLPCTTFGTSLSHLASFAKTLHRPPPRPRRGRPKAASRIPA